MDRESILKLGEAYQQIQEVELGLGDRDMSPEAQRKARERRRAQLGTRPGMGVRGQDKEGIGIGAQDAPFVDDNTPTARGGASGRVVAPKGGVMGTMIPGQPDSWKPSEGSGGARDQVRWQNRRGADQLQKDIDSLGAAGQKAIKDFEAKNPNSKLGADPITDANRKTGYHDVEVNGQKVKRWWDAKNKNWRVDPNDRMTLGMDKPNDPRAQAIRSLSQGGLGPGGLGANDGTTDLGDNINSGMNNIRSWFKNNLGIGPGRVDRFGQPVKDGEAANDLEREGGGRQRALDVADDKMKGGDGSTVPDPKVGTTPTQNDEPESDSPAEDTPQKPDVTQKGPNSAGLTPMQQWAKNFPKLAAKVRPGQAGYDEIQKMNSPQSQARSSVSQTKVGDMNKADNNVQQAFKNNQQMNDISKPITRAASKSKDFSDKMNKAPTPSMSRTPKAPVTPKTPKPMDRIDKATTGVKRLPGLPEEFNLDAVLDAMADGLNEGRGMAAGKSDYDKMRERNKEAGMTPGNTYATAQRRMRSGLQRGKKKDRGAKTGGKPAWMSDEQWLAHTKGQLALKRPESVAGKRARDNEAQDKAELGGTKNNRGS